MVNMWQPVSFGGGQSGGMFGVSGSAGGSQAVPGSGAMEGILKLAEALMKRGAQQGQMANFQEAMKAYEGWKPPDGEAIYSGEPRSQAEINAAPLAPPTGEPIGTAGPDTRLGGGLNALVSVLSQNQANLPLAQKLMFEQITEGMKPQAGYTLGENQVRYNAANRPVAKGPEKAKFREIDMPIDNDKRQRLVSYDDGKTWQKFGTPFSTRDPFIIQESVDENGNMIRQAFPREAVAAQMAAGMASPRGKGAESPATDPVVPGQQMGGVVLGTKPNPNVFKPLPSAEIENYQQALQAWRSLKTMESTIDVTGRVRGLQSKTEAFLGTDKRAVDFETARNNFRLSAQALIKGIPSNFDVQTVIETLPSLTIAETSNRSRLDFAKQSFKDLVEGSIAYYKSLGYRSPAFVDKLAKEMDIDASKVEPWDRKGDPLQKAIDRMGKSKENDPLGIR